MVPDEQLVIKILARDRRALHFFFRKYAPKLSRFIGAKVASRPDAEEVLQDTLFAFLEAIRDYQGRSNVQTFLFSICKHKIIDFYRRKKIRHAVFSQVPQLESIISPLLGPEDELDETLMRQKIQTVFARLLPRYRQILVMKYMEGFSVSEIARKLSLTFKSVESQLFRARRAFVELFISI